MSGMVIWRSNLPPSYAVSGGPIICALNFLYWPGTSSSRIKSELTVFFTSSSSRITLFCAAIISSQADRRPRSPSCSSCGSWPQFSSPATFFTYEYVCSMTYSSYLLSYIEYNCTSTLYYLCKYDICTVYILYSLRVQY